MNSVTFSYFYVFIMQYYTNMIDQNNFSILKKKMTQPVTFIKYIKNIEI